MVAKVTSGLSQRCELWEKWGRRKLGQHLRNLCSLPSPPQSSQLSKRLVQFVTLGLECTVCFIWTLSSPTLATLKLYFLLQPWHLAVNHSCSHLPTSNPTPSPSPQWVLFRLWGLGAERALEERSWTLEG